MLYIRYWIILDGQSIKKKSVLEISTLELPRPENFISRLCALDPLVTPLPPPPRTHPNRVKNTSGGYSLLVSMSLCTEVEGLGGKGRSRSFAPSPRALPPACGARRNRGTSRSRLCLFRARPPVRQVRHGYSAWGRRRYGVGRPKGAMRRRGLPHWQPHGK